MEGKSETETRVICGCFFLKCLCLPRTRYSRLTPVFVSSFSRRSVKAFFSWSFLSSLAFQLSKFCWTFCAILPFSLPIRWRVWRMWPLTPWALEAMRLFPFNVIYTRLIVSQKIIDVLSVLQLLRRISAKISVHEIKTEKPSFRYSKGQGRICVSYISFGESCFQFSFSLGTEDIGRWNLDRIRFKW